MLALKVSLVFSDNILTFHVIDDYQYFLTCHFLVASSRL